MWPKDQIAIAIAAFLMLACFGIPALLAVWRRLTRREWAVEPEAADDQFYYRADPKRGVTAGAWAREGK